MNYTSALVTQIYKIGRGIFHYQKVIYLKFNFITDGNK